MEVYCTNSAVWAVWRVRDGDLEDTLIQHLTYDGWALYACLVEVFVCCTFLLILIRDV